jgi:hypothetical protein
MPATWVVVAVGALLVVHLALVALAIRRDSRYPITRVDPRDTEQTGHDTGIVRCRECGATNEAGYRYCRACVGELPTGVSPVTADSGGESRRTT